MNKALKYLTLVFILSTISVFPFWHHQATKREQFYEIKVPEFLAPAFARYYGHDSPEVTITAGPQGTQNVSMGFYSIAIHKSQIHPWWTVWRKTVFAVRTVGDLEWAGEANFPASRP